MKSFYSAVRTGSLNKAVCASSLNGLMFNAELRIVQEINHQTARSYNPRDHNTLQNLQASYILN